MHFVSLATVAALPVLACAGVLHGYSRGHVARSYTSASATSRHIPTPYVRMSVASPLPKVGEETQSGNWTTAICDNTIDDATQDPQSRWNAAGGPGALTDVVNAWLSEGSSSNLNFPEFVSYYFAGPDNWNCQDISNIPCSTVVTCNDVNHPAG
ncbi:uncharacterized protein N7482_003193 [Penicillium canariense]|uniref:Uncharacterized protein n=1 Tax=Penicillium canariense TaxID=189055 RepID=A0A9W9I6K4_9EURO|nr:uncharacterized protein N7482_003193 [Penicillium canariense]KAJ5167599.1 hypothetical protein N7482_003193 [Penicillium canariense]